MTNCSLCLDPNSAVYQRCNDEGMERHNFSNTTTTTTIVLQSTPSLNLPGREREKKISVWDWLQPQNLSLQACFLWQTWLTFFTVQLAVSCLHILPVLLPHGRLATIFLARCVTFWLTVTEQRVRPWKAAVKVQPCEYDAVHLEDDKSILKFNTQGIYSITETLTWYNPIPTKQQKL